jgi:hypothetical protein
VRETVPIGLQGILQARQVMTLAHNNGWCHENRVMDAV